MQIYGWELLVVSIDPDKFSDERFCESKDLMLLICYVTWSDHMWKGLWTFMGGSPSKLVPTFAYLLVFGLVQIEI